MARNIRDEEEANRKRNPEDWEPVEIEGVKGLSTNPVKTALRVQLEDGRTLWLPQYAILDDSEVYEPNTSGKLVITKKMAIEKGLV